MKIIKKVGWVIAVVLMIDLAGFVVWATSGQKPVDNFFIGSVTTHLLKSLNKDEIVLVSPRASYLNSTQRIMATVSPSLEKMIMDAEEDGICLVVVSGYRTYEEQQRLYHEAKDKSLVAIPGTSEHELGIAVDLGACPMSDGIRDDNTQRLELRKPFGELPEYAWLVKNGASYGFSQSYENEPWHWKSNK
jgi:LAS superfamily LD-carboxypeptidase LdcB